MAKLQPITTKVIDNGLERTMTQEEFDAYQKITAEAKSLIDASKLKNQQKEIAIAKLVALGLTESDIRAVIL